MSLVISEHHPREWALELGLVVEFIRGIPSNNFLIRKASGVPLCICSVCWERVGFIVPEHPSMAVYLISAESDSERRTHVDWRREEYVGSLSEVREVALGLLREFIALDPSRMRDRLPAAERRMTGARFRISPAKR